MFLTVYDFVCDYEMTSANIQYKQSVNYTYFKGSTRTYIDHVFVSDQLQDNTVDCVILPYDVENTSDYLPMKTTIKLQTEQPRNNQEVDHTNMSITSKIDWNVNDNRLKYTNHVDHFSMSITPPTDTIVSRESAQLQFDTTCQQIINCIQMASNCVAKKISQPKSIKKRNHGGHILRKWLSQESHSGTTYEMTATNPEMVMCTVVISYQNPDTDRLVG